MIEFERINNTQNALWHQALNIYREAFPAEEQQPQQTLEQRITSPKGIVIVGKIQREIVCLGILWNLEQGNFTLLEYLCVHKKYRSRGIGHQLLEHISQQDDLKHRTIVAEVESPEPGPMQLFQKRRINFYFKNDYQLLKDVHSFVPPLSGNTPTPILLMVHSLKPAFFYSKETISTLLKQIYCEIYSLNPENKLLHKICSQLPNNIILMH